MIQYSWYNVTKPSFFEGILSWLNDCVFELFPSVELVHYIFCDDRYILNLNQESLNHDYFTDILTFDLRESLKDPLECEIYISLDTVRDNSLIYKTEYKMELMRVMVHGLLHLTGLDDLSEGEKEDMRASEDGLLNKYNSSTWNN